MKSGSVSAIRSSTALRRRAGGLCGALAAAAMAVLCVSQSHGQTTTKFSTAGNTTWVCPAGVTSVQVQAWGGGGGGGGVGANFAGAGGGAGGSFVNDTTLSVTPGNTYNLTVAAGGTGGAGGAAGTGTNGVTGGTSYFGNSVVKPCGKKEKGRKGSLKGAGKGLRPYSMDVATSPQMDAMSPLRYSSPHRASM
jgi:hypothetical protein